MAEVTQESGEVLVMARAVVALTVGAVVAADTAGWAVEETEGQVVFLTVRRLSRLTWVPVVAPRTTPTVVEELAAERFA